MKWALSLWTYLLTLLLIGSTFFFPLVAGITAALLAFFPPMDIVHLFLSFGVDLVLLVASLIPVLIVFMRLWLTIPSVALEGLSGWKAVKRSSTYVQYDPS